MKKILIIDESPLFKEYLSKKLEFHGFQIVTASNGLDGMVKLRSDLPDLVIMDYYLSRKSSLGILQEKMKNPNTSEIPVIMVSNKIDASKVIEIATFNVKKFFSKPLRLNELLRSVGDFLDESLMIDDAPCVIEAHFNDNILFIEVSQGLNEEKIDLLRYKIKEILSMYKCSSPKVLIMMSGLDIGSEDSVKMGLLLDHIIDNAQSHQRYIKMLTSSPSISKFIVNSHRYSGIEVVTSLDAAMDKLLGGGSGDVIKDEAVKNRLLSSSEDPESREQAVHMGYDQETAHEHFVEGAAQVAIVDDDFVIRELVKTAFEDSELVLTAYSNGLEFLRSDKLEQFDLVFLDLMMPEMNGFQVLEQLRQKQIDFPVIIFSALGRKETVVKAKGYDVYSYLIKPIKPETLLLKARALLNRNF